METRITRGWRQYTVNSIRKFVKSMELLRGNALFNYKQELVMVNDALREIRYLGLYFTAAWCPPCQIFLPLLKSVYERTREAELKFEIIYIPSDYDEDNMLECFTTKHGPWYAIPAGRVAEALRKKYHVISLPTLIILDKNGQVMTKNGRIEIEEHSDKVLSLWFPEFVE
ncbi:nucleoredoxin-like [Cephus cinctus]|uniref:Nucleoredoxin-like n=1 Tax=Cephus cinctus TaxID=211228 RepID=A0AAJ7RNQ8_CEPCN|nr:nucleoredoxin-like [Cephus cinctus]